MSHHPNYQSQLEAIASSCSMSCPFPPTHLMNGFAFEFIINCCFFPFYVFIAFNAAPNLQRAALNILFLIYYSSITLSSPSEDELPPEVEPCARCRTATAWCTCASRIHCRATRSRWSGSLLTKYLTLVMSNFCVHIVNESRIILFTKDEGKGVYHFYQSTVSVITCCTSSF